MFPTEVGDLLGSQGMEFWTSPAPYDEVNGNTELADNADLISQELEEGKEKGVGVGSTSLLPLTFSCLFPSLFPRGDLWAY